MRANNPSQVIENITHKHLIREVSRAPTAFCDERLRNSKAGQRNDALPAVAPRLIRVVRRRRCSAEGAETPQRREFVAAGGLMSYALCSKFERELSPARRPSQPDRCRTIQVYLKEAAVSGGVPAGSPCSAKTVLAFARSSPVGAKKKGMPS